MKSSTRRLLAAAASTLAAVAFAAPTVATAAPPTPSRPAGHIGGIIPVHGNAHVSNSSFRFSNNLSYHGGPILQTDNVYLIYWDPAQFSGDPNYTGLVNRFVSDVSAGYAATNTNVYSIDTQYSNGSGQHITYGNGSITLAGTLPDTNPFPTGLCSDSVTSICLTDGQIQQEIQKDIGGFGTLKPNPYFVMLTAPGVGSCISSSECAFTYYCAYHGTLNSGGYTYANMPYAYTDPSACSAGQSPTGDPSADAEINLLSHEHNETITDPQLNAWYDRQGSEIGDKCAWNFGSATGPTGARYNQTINGNHYYLQQEWNNQVSGCALHL